MNKIFKVIFNPTLNAFVVVSELAKTHVKSKSSNSNINKTQSKGKTISFGLNILTLSLIAGNAFAYTAGSGVNTDNTGVAIG